MEGLVASPLHMYWFPDIVMKNFALRIFYIKDANERQNKLPLGYRTIHDIFLLTVRQIRIFFNIKPSLFQRESSFKARGGPPFGGVREQTQKKTRLTH